MSWALRRIARRLGYVVAAMSVSLASCGDGPATSDGVRSTPGVVSPGATLPLGTTVSLDADGTYSLPAQAATITVRCFGQVTVAFTTPGGSTRNNTCRSAGGTATQTNSVTYVSDVMFDFDAGGSAEVTVQ